MCFFLSIISPIRNEEKYLTECLASLVNQEYDNEKYEILVVDGMSTDRTREIVKEFETRYKNVKLLDNPNETVPYALNIGIKQARGDVIIRVDGHAVIEKDYLHQCVKYLKRTNAECVGGIIESINQTFIGRAIALAMSSRFGVGNVRFRTTGEEGYVDCLAFGAYRREIFDKIGYFDEEFVRCQDDEFNYRLRKFDGKIFLTPKIKSYYYPRSNLKKLWRQYFQYGLWKIRGLQRHFKTMQPRQFVPSIFVSSLMVTGIFGIFSKITFSVFLLIIIVYVTVSLSISVKISINKGFTYFCILPVIFFILHASYGLGFLWGLIKFSKFWINDKPPYLQNSIEAT